MRAVQVTENFWVAPQVAAEDMPALAEAGITALINNRPDGEEFTQPSGADLEAAAQAAGLTMRHVPVTGAGISDDDIRDFQTALEQAPGPVLAHCRSGTRSLTIWVLGEVLAGRMAVADIPALEGRTGYDLTGARMWLARRGL